MLCLGFFSLFPASFCFLPITHTETLRGQANTLNREMLMADHYNWSTTSQSKGFGQRIKEGALIR